MKPEIIVAKIEEYINSLPKENRESYDGVMEIKTKHPEENVKTFASVLSDPILNLAVIVDELKQEIKEGSIKQTRGSSVLRRIKAINKFLTDKNNKNDKMRKAWVEDDKMCITNGYVGFMFNAVLDGVQIREVGQDDFQLAKCFPNEYDLVKTELDIADVKSQLKIHKAKETGKKAKDKTTCIYIIEGHYYNAEYLIKAYDILSGNIIFNQPNSPVSPAVMTSENGKAIILPIRQQKRSVA